jgi:hypothetical protein
VTLLPTDDHLDELIGLATVAARDGEDGAGRIDGFRRRGGS